MREYDTTGARSIAELDPNSTYALAYGLIPAGSRVLDLGCGSGELASYLAARGDRVWGVDINAAALAQAAPSCVATREADLEEIDLASLFPGLRFDVVVLTDVLEHVRQPWNVLQSARAVLDAGGCVVASIPNFAHAAVRLAVVSGAMPYRGLGILDGTHVRFFTLNSIMSLFEESGFRLQEIMRTMLPFDAASDLVPDVRLLRVPDDIERHVRDDAENETLQFVVRAVMLPGEWNMDALRDRLHDVEARSEEQAIGLRNLRRELAAAVALAENRATQLTAVAAEHATQIAALDAERAAQVSALEDTLKTAVADVRKELRAALTERDEALAARSNEAETRRAAQDELAGTARALRAAVEERDEARSLVAEAREEAHSRESAHQRDLDDARSAIAEAHAQFEARETARRVELETAERQVAELRDALFAARERLRSAGEERTRLETVVLESEQQIAALRAELTRCGEREASAAKTLAAADRDRAARDEALAHAARELRQAKGERDRYTAALDSAEEAFERERAEFARCRAEAEGAQETLRTALRAALSELEPFRRRARYEALAWMARSHDELADAGDGAQFWKDGAVTG